ncbi:hypothetical protein BJY00DRAFT_279276 [Aspergillus carlsbadensis]|nr:hypothetical protein BJY00DRAFT_279276 [Aspergillus carlsbadensis]
MATSTTLPSNDFRDDVYAYSKTLLSRPEFKPIFDPWVESVKTPFSGITTDGHKVENIYQLEENGAPTEEMVAAANRVLEFMPRKMPAV